MFSLVVVLYFVISYCKLGRGLTCFCQYLFQLGELGRLSASMKKLEKDLKGSDKYDVIYHLLSLEQFEDCRFFFPLHYIRFLLHLFDAE